MAIRPHLHRDTYSLWRFSVLCMRHDKGRDGSWIWEVPSLFRVTAILPACLETDAMSEDTPHFQKHLLMLGAWKTLHGVLPGFSKILNSK